MIQIKFHSFWVVEKIEALALPKKEFIKPIAFKQILEKVFNILK